MPLMFGVFGFAFPAGLILYWTVSNLFQIGQQAVMLRLGHIGPQALDRRLTEAKSKAETRTDKPRTGIMGRMMERAEQERKRRLGEPEPLRKPPLRALRVRTRPRPKAPRRVRAPGLGKAIEGRLGG